MSRVVLITGTSTGLGLELSVVLAQAGDRVYATMRNLTKQDALLERAKASDVEVQVLQLDVQDWASGQAAVVIDMLRAVDLSEQEDTLREISRRRPEVAQAVFSQICLESTALVAPQDVVSDAMLRTPVETLTALLRGTREDVRNYLVEQAPPSIRSAVVQELELGIPVVKSEYLEGRRIFTDTLASILQREGEDLVAMNARVIDRHAHEGTQHA